MATNIFPKKDSPKLRQKHRGIDD